jgi:hypothetical protein
MTSTSAVMKETALQRPARAVARPLKVLIPLIQADLERGDRAGMEYYADAGDKLIEAKGQVAHGYWGTWLSKNFHLVDRVAQRYMRLARLRAENIENRRPASDLPRSLSEMEGHTARRQERHQAERAYKSVLRELETDLYAQEKQTREDEVQLHRDMALELIDVGFKALATRLHPDRGGSKEAMARLNRVRNELKGVAETRRFV